MLDVLVIGGGPVGVTLALLCANRGMSTMVVERDMHVYNLPRAIVMDAEILRVFQGAGLSQQLAALTTPLQGAEFVDTAGARIIGVDLPSTAPGPLGHHFTVCYYQPELEAFLRSAALNVEVQLRLGTSAVDVRQRSDGAAEATLITADTPDEPVVARWIVAADGASSPIRKSLGISFDSLGFDQDWLVVDTELLNDGVQLPVCAQQICDPARPATYVPGHGRYRRWEFQLQVGESRDEMAHPNRVWDLLSPWITQQDARLVRAVVYRFHATVASAMRKGSIFLAGDSAHQMPPFLGQGLCSGIRDAANLAWKLQLVASSNAGDELLDSYDSERRPHAEGVVAHAADTGRLIDQLSGRTETNAAIESAYGGGRPFPGLIEGILAGRHPLVGRQLPQPSIDGELLDSLLGTGFAVITQRAADVPSDVRKAWESIGTRFVALPDSVLSKMHVDNGHAVIVRPDRYVAAVASSADDLRAVTTTLFDRMSVGAPRH